MSDDNVNTVAEDGGASASTPLTVTTNTETTSNGQLKSISLDDITFVHGVGSHSEDG